MDGLTKLFKSVASTPKPQSHGINFEDVYLNDNFEICERSPDNNCYVKVPHQYNLSEEDF